MTPPACFRFCPQCGGDLVTRRPADDEHDRLVCARCGFVFYLNPKPTVCALIVHGGRILLARRGREPFLGWWDLPGGFLEWGEDPTEAMIREVIEETTLEVSPIRLLGAYADYYGEGGDSTVNLAYLAEWIAGDPRPQSDITELAWFGRDEIPDQLAFTCIRAAIEGWLAIPDESG